MRFVFTVLAGLLCVFGTAVAQNVVQIGSLKDNTLFEDAGGALSNGAGQNMYVGRNNLAQLRRGVLAFDVAGSVPAGSVVDSVILTLFMSQSSSGGSDIELRTLTQNWGEGTSNSGGGQGAPATTGDATWIHTFYDSSFWSSQGGDFSTSVSATQNVIAVGFYRWGSTPAMVADVQGWLDNPSANFGWILIGDETVNQTAKRFDTREHATMGNRPALTVYWSGTTAVDEEGAEFPERFSLYPNFPNPFNPSTTIGYFLPVAARVTLRVYDQIGQEVTTLVDGFQSSGFQTITWGGEGSNGVPVPSGVYHYRLTARGSAESSGETFVQTRSMMLIK